ncbi:hypothetical protein V1508DRAFT_426833 [Lipomyces doorenjongii]|uniref:uncharacterized protein n=1 Tax=Lipomyces doorenjongii TaxID=383834 RepID=UPI0034CE49A3
MLYIFRVLFLVLALAYTTTAKKFPPTLCLFKGHPKYDPQEIIFWLEEKGNKNHMPFYSLSDLGFSDFKSIKVALKDGLKGDALLYLYHNREAENENVAFVKFEKTGYHFSGSEKLDFEKFKELGGEKVVVDFGSCAKGKYHWDYDVSTTEGTIAGELKRANNYP